MAAVIGGAVPSVLDARAIGTEQVHFLAGVTVGAGTFNSVVNFTALEAIALQAVTSINADGYSVVVVDQGTTGGDFDAAQFVHPSPGSALQGEDNGHTLAVFTGSGAVRIVGTSGGIQFGPSILAPFAHVDLHGSANFVDG